MKSISVLHIFFAAGILIAGVAQLHQRLLYNRHVEGTAHTQSRVTALEKKFEFHKKREGSAHKAVSIPEEADLEPDGEPDSKFDKPEPECRDGEKLMKECAPKKRLKNEGNRNWCVEVAEGPPKTDDHVMHRAGYEADDKLRKHVAWLRHGLGTRAKDKKRVVRYYNVTHEVAQVICPFLDCSELWLGVEWDKTPGVVRTCKVMKGKQCEY